MTKLSIAFLAGVLMMAGIVYVSGPRSFAIPMFFAGSLAVVVPIAALLSSVKRILAVARFLNSFGRAMGGRIQEQAVERFESSRETIGYKKPSRKAQLQMMTDAVEEYKSRMTKPAPAEISLALLDDELFGTPAKVN